MNHISTDIYKNNLDHLLNYLFSSFFILSEMQFS